MVIDVTIVQSDVTIVVPWQLSTGSKHDYLFCYCPLVRILFEVLRIASTPITHSAQQSNGHTLRQTVQHYSNMLRLFRWHTVPAFMALCSL